MSTTVNTSLTVHSLLVLTSLCSYKYLDNVVSWVRGIMALHLIIGVCGMVFNLTGTYGSDEQLTSINAYYRCFVEMGLLLTLPFFVAELYQRYDYELSFACLHVCFALVPLMNGNTVHRDVLVLCNLVSLAILAKLERNGYALATVPVYYVAHFVVYGREELLGVPGVDMYVLMLAALNVIIVKAITEDNKSLEQV